MVLHSKQINGDFYTMIKYQNISIDRVNKVILSK